MATKQDGACPHRPPLVQIARGVMLQEQDPPEADHESPCPCGLPRLVIELTPTHYLTTQDA